MAVVNNIIDEKSPKILTVENQLAAFESQKNINWDTSQGQVPSLLLQATIKDVNSMMMEANDSEVAAFKLYVTSIFKARTAKFGAERKKRELHKLVAAATTSSANAITTANDTTGVLTRIQQGLNASTTWGVGRGASCPY